MTYIKINIKYFMFRCYAVETKLLVPLSCRSVLSSCVYAEGQLSIVGMQQVEFAL